ncbi:MAG: cation diffusion facilitator family transporter [Candidatus Kapaibacteriales bacterium]
MSTKTLVVLPLNTKLIQKLYHPIIAARISFLVSSLLALFIILLGYIENSIFYQTNGLVALTDIINSAILLYAVAYSERTPDIVYNYGYGKYESFGIFVTSTVITIVTIYTLFATFQSLSNIQPIGNYSILSIFSFAWIITMFQMHKFLKKVYNNSKLEILRYDAELWKNDSIIEIGVLLNLILCFLLNHFGFVIEARIFDSIGAIVLVGIAMRIPIKYGKKSIDQLLDRTLPEQFHYDILAVIAENFKFLCEFQTIHTRQSGKDIFVEIDVVLPFDFTLEEAYFVQKQIEDKIKQKYPNSLPRVYYSPCKHDCIHQNTYHCPIKKWIKQNNSVTNGK